MSGRMAVCSTKPRMATGASSPSSQQARSSRVEHPDRFLSIKLFFPFARLLHPHVLPEPPSVYIHTAMSALGSEYASPQLVWHLIRGNNSYLKKNLNNTYFSYEPNNLAGRHSFKYSGIANDKAISVRASSGEDVGVEVSKKSVKTGKTVVSINKRGAGRVMAAVQKEVGDYRPDLKEFATSAAGVAAGAAARSGVEADATA
eukprot:jgi/Ulvmu1/12657/UM094_0013.1